LLPTNFMISAFLMERDDPGRLTEYQ